MCSLCRPSPFQSPRPSDPGEAALWQRVARDAQAALEAARTENAQLRAEVERLRRILEPGETVVDGLWVQRPPKGVKA